MFNLKPNKWLAVLRQADGTGGGEAAPAGGLEGTVVAAPAGVVPAPADTSALSEGGTAQVPPAVTEPAAEPVVEAFDVAKLTLPEGVTLPEESGKTLAELLNDGKLSPQERGQKLTDLYAASMKAASEAAVADQSKTWNDLNSQWREEVKKLPEFAADVDGQLGSIKQALTTAGATEDFFKALDLTGAGNNPAVLQMFHKLTRHLVEGGPVGGGAKPASTASRAALMYPSMRAKE